MQYYRGDRYMRGHGLGSVFGSLFRAGVPLLKKVGTYLGRQLLDLGSNTLADVGEGKGFKESIKKRAMQSKRKIVSDAKHKLRKRVFGAGANPIFFAKGLSSKRNKVSRKKNEKGQRRRQLFVETVVKKKTVKKRQQKSRVRKVVKKSRKNRKKLLKKGRKTDRALDRARNLLF